VQYAKRPTTIPLRGSTLQANGSGKIPFSILYGEKHIVYAYVKA